MDFEFLFIMLSIFAPVILIVAVKKHYDYKKEVVRSEAAHKSHASEQENRQLQLKVLDLQKRVEVLEAIVTDKGYEVKESIRALHR